MEVKMTGRDRILLGAKAEDLDALESTLASLGYEVCAVAASGHMLADKAKDAAPDLALIDMGMEGAADSAWKVSIRLGIPVVYLLDEHQYDSLPQARAADPLGYVLKPFDTRQLQLTLSACRDTRRRLEEPRSITEFPRERLLATIFQRINECVSIVDTNGVIRYANPASARSVGMEDPETAETRLENYRFYEPDKTTPIAWSESPPMRAIRLGESSENVEVYLLPPNRTEGILMSMDVQPLYDEGHRTGCLAVFRDIGEQWQIERELQGTSATLRFERDRTNLILENLADGIIVTDGAGRVVLFNPVCRDFFGWHGSDDTEITLENNFDWVKVPDKSRPFPSEELPVIKALSGISTDNAEMYMSRPDGEDVYMSVSARPILDESGTVLATVSVIRDVTAVKTRELELEATADQLAEQTQALDAMLDGIADGVILMDARGAVQRFNRAALEIATPELIQDLPLDTSKPGVGLFYADRVTPIPPDDAPFRATLRGETLHHKRVFIVHPSMPDGTLVSVSTRKIGTRTDATSGVVVLFSDAAADHQREQSLIHAFAEGQQEATGAVLHNIGNALTSVVTGIESLRERVGSPRPLNRLSALAELLKAHRTDLIDYLSTDPQGQQAIPFLLALNEEWQAEHAENKRILERIAKRVQHIADILRKNRSSSFPSTTHKIVPLKKTLWDGVRILEASLQKRGIAITVDCSRAPYEIDIQESRLHEMLVNLVRNCIEAIEDLPQDDSERRPAVAITSYVEDGRLFIEVTDNGAGIEPSHLDSIFAPGFTTKKEGTGLGLHSAANYVIDSGGKITALSEGRGKGTTIRIDWPSELRIPSRQSAKSGGRTISRPRRTPASNTSSIARRKKRSGA